jgi:hypothetical protein
MARYFVCALLAIYFHLRCALALPWSYLAVLCCHSQGHPC